MTRAVIADDEVLMREQLRARLEELWPELEIVAEAKNGVEAVEQVAALRPEVVFLDIRMPAKTGIERGDLSRGFDAGLRRHADVEEDHFGTERGDLLDGLDPVLRFRHDLELGPELVQARAQLLAHQGFVVGDYRTGHVAL